MKQFEKLVEDIQEIPQKHSGKISFSTSLGMEDQLITAAIARSGIEVEIFTLDTGRLFPETYELLQRTERLYDLRIRVYNPDQQALEHYVQVNGINAFYEDSSLRKECCAIRKIGPLKRALSGTAVWVTGLRASQSQNRSEFTKWMYDDAFQLQKFNPLIDWEIEEIEQAIHHLNVPISPLHQKGFKSIGCAPCTRALEPGEPERAGRWWWENSKKECGLHSART